MRHIAGSSVAAVVNTTLNNKVTSTVYQLQGLFYSSEYRAVYDLLGFQRFAAQTVKQNYIAFNLIHFMGQGAESCLAFTTLKT